MFCNITNNKSSLPVITEPLYLPEHQGIYINVKPVKNDHQLIISFAMESIDKFYKDKPESVLVYLLGHEGTGSILAKLKKNQWAMGLMAGSGINGSNFKDFNISISLTELGESNIDEIISIVFSYIGLLKSTKLPPFYYQEKQAIAELSFTYHEKTRPLDNVSQLVINMQHYPCEDYIFGDYIMSGMDDDNINHLLNYLNADNMRIIHVSQNNHFSKTSFWYQVPYNVNKISTEKLTHWHNLSTPSYTNFKLNKALFTPKANPYISGSPHIHEDVHNSLVPTKIENTSGLTVWYKQDTTFKVPKGYIYLGIDSPYSVECTENIAMTRLFIELFTHTVLEENYDAELACIHYHLYAHQGGLTLQLSGISENQPKLLKKLLYRITHHNSSKDDFTLFKQQLIKQWQNSDKSKSISQLFSTLSSFMQPNNPNADELSASLINISFPQYQNFCHMLFEQVTLEALIHGNWLLEDAKSIITDIKRTFTGNYSKHNSVKCPVIDISNKKTLILPIQIPNHDHASVIYTPLPSRDNDLIALTMVTSHLLSPLFFQNMRTDKQYGYLVGVGYVPINRYPGIAFYIQSPHTDAIALTKAMDEFISNSLDTLADMSNKNWLHLINGLAAQLQEKDNNLRIQSQRFWAAICNKDLTFSHKEQLVSAILSLKLKQVKTFIKEQLMTIAKPDRIILSSMKSTNPVIKQKLHDELNGEIISKLDDFIEKSKRKY